MSILISIDQGTTSSRCLAFDTRGQVLAVAQREFAQHFPADGWVEHEPDDLWQSTLATLGEVVARLEGRSRDIAAIGITNQRETTLVWDRRTGEPLHRAIVWQDRRTAPECARLREEGAEPALCESTGLLLDPYFSATKIAWILDNVEGARDRAERGELAFGTVDTFLLWRLTGGAVHATDATNASRTALFDLRTQDWNPELLRLFGVPRSMLPQVFDSAADFGVVREGLPASGVPILGIAGDQQAALIGQGCLAAGQAKSTYGTGCFLVLNTGMEPVWSHNRLLTTVAYRVDGVAHYAMEGSIFVAGAAVKWLRGWPWHHLERRRDRRHRRACRWFGRGLSGARLHGAGRTALGPGRTRCADRPYPRQRRGGHRHGHAAIGGLPDPRSGGGHGP